MSIRFYSRNEVMDHTAETFADMIKGQTSSGVKNTPYRRGKMKALRNAYEVAAGDRDDGIISPLNKIKIFRRNAIKKAEHRLVEENLVQAKKVLEVAEERGSAKTRLTELRGAVDTWETWETG